ncbi:MAG: TonB-dependent receptor [Marinilabiliales bacterium]|nr:MAG: TonB-dependent receptor [Marinilabiliales bacterium]
MFKKVQITVLFFLLFNLGLMAQYSLKGRVYDTKNGKSLPGATVMLDNTFRATATDKKGEFTLSKLKAGDYMVKISFIGYKTLRKTIELNSNKTMEFALEPTIYMSDEIIVRASRDKANSNNAKTEISQSDLKSVNTGQDLPYLLSMSPSMVITSDAGSGIGYTGMRIRGSDLSRINVTLNGVPVNDGESQGVFFVDLPDLASSVDNIQIQRGVGTSTNGAAAFGASINIKTDEFSADPYAELNSAAGSFNTLKSSLKFGSGLIGGKWNFNGRVSTITSEGYIDRASSDLKSAYLSGSYYGDKDILKAVVIIGKEKTYQAWYGIPKDSLETNRTYNPAGEILDDNGNIIGYYDNQTDNYWQNYYQLHYARELNSKLTLSASGFYTRGYGFYENYKNAESFSEYGMNDTIIGNDTIRISDMITQKWLDNNFYGFNLNLIYDKFPFKLTTGGGWNQYDGDHYGKVIWSQIARKGDYDRNWYFNNGLKTEANIFAKIEYIYAGKLTVFEELQFRKINYKIKGNHDDLRNLSQEHDFNFLNPKFGLSYKINENNNAFASMAVTHREPNRSVYRDSDPGVDVKHEKLTDIEVGYVFATTKFSAGANFYYMIYKDQLVLTGKINNVGAPIMQNVDKSYRRGIEIEAGWKIAGFLNWNFNTTLSSNKIKNFKSFIDDYDTWPVQRIETFSSTDISFSPSIIANNEFEITPFKNFVVSLTSSYVGKQFIDNTSNANRSIDPYLINNVRINYGIETNFIKRIDFLLSLNNVFNEKYSSNAWVYSYYSGDNEYDMFGYYPQAGFNFMLGINLKF